MLYYTLLVLYHTVPAADIWSLGVVFLELLLGTDDVFSVDQRTAAMIQQRLRGASETKLKRGTCCTACSINTLQNNSCCINSICNLWYDVLY